MMGGVSSEREISLKSGKAVCEALEDAGCRIKPIDIVSDDPPGISELLSSARIDCAFVALHGYFGEDGRIQEILERLRIPYTGSGVKASRLAMDKLASRKVFETNGLRVPSYEVVHREYYDAGSAVGLGLCLPLVVKPVQHGSSIGLSIIDDRGELLCAIEKAFRVDTRALVEEFVRGREVTVGILDEQPLPVIEIVPKSRFFDFEAKYQSADTEYTVPAKLSDEVARRCQGHALCAHKLLGCSGYSRVDMILDEHETPCILEVNTIPGLTATSLLPKAAKAAGIGFSRLCRTLVKGAYEKTDIYQETV